LVSLCDCEDADITPHPNPLPNTPTTVGKYSLPTEDHNKEESRVIDATKGPTAAHNKSKIKHLKIRHSKIRRLGK